MTGKCFFSKDLLFLFLSVRPVFLYQKVQSNMNETHVFQLYVIVDTNLISDAESISRNYFDRLKSIMTLVNKIYMPLNIHFQIVKIELFNFNVYSLYPEYHLPSELKILKSKANHIHHDCLHAFIHSRTDWKRDGYGEDLSMCSKHSCVAYTMDSSKLTIQYAAQITSHELGHVFGMVHDVAACECSNCIMATGIEINIRSLLWSVCSFQHMRIILRLGFRACRYETENNWTVEIIGVETVKNIKRTMSFILCGNGILEGEEECDCGTYSPCKKCCDSRFCKLRRHAECASGTCCNILTCKLQKTNKMCRRSGDFCDLPEFCDGVSEICSTDLFRQDGEICQTLNNETAYCIRGQCQGPITHCKYLWGETATVGDESCYRENIGKSHNFKNCGFDETEKTEYPNVYTKRKLKSCSTENYLCGRLWCVHEAEKPIPLGINELFSFYIANNYCDGIKYEDDWYDGDIGLVPDGSVCGQNKICLNSKCIDVQSIRNGSCNCHNHGVCNNQGGCFCFDGYMQPDCRSLEITTTDSVHSTERTTLSQTTTVKHTGDDRTKKKLKLLEIVLSIIVIVFIFVIIAIFLWHLKSKVKFTKKTAKMKTSPRQYQPVLIILESVKNNLRSCQHPKNESSQKKFHDFIHSAEIVSTEA